LVAAAAVEDFLCFLLLCLWLALFVEGADESAAVGAADVGLPAAIEAAAKPSVNKAVVMRVADLFMKSPGRVIDKRREEYARSNLLHRDEDHFTKP
jgi:hypothetical protein